ncbi:MAG: hypothetical protein V7735_19805 [Photobacterium frigidiphilum]|uniref:hypothetical protein n=1 Tax=Photobacterium frigidiphilum TaxID=264736 RepID=UPI003002E828
MRNIADFIEKIESGKYHYVIWIYSSEGHYCQFNTQRNKPRTLQLQKAIEQNLQVIVEMHSDEIDNAFLLLPEVHVVVPVKFHGNQVLSITRPQAA